ncbi:tryptophan--tRNA ligase [Helcococcus kunzii]|uniref:Tryptophan--tRNA ligase n=1 Tax=Helcococcus kunzii ATCC 51366 TaxID=883114 RepID=H3NMD3_9FIRM|nr:tryptophan--tRNA ligase [Helcococcus kunzii]EHR35068.1 tryptophan-tRNA ligase [Helcococcus kunzii ATCC 51366]QUY64449.1 tryptophan--tRNA ligase [Helcococcus kunzii]
MTENKKVVLSLVQPTGDLTIGNYLGAIQNFIKLQEKYECYIGIADLHSITVPQVPAELRRRTKSVLATYMALGLDPEKVALFVQSHNLDHLKLYWVLNTISYMGQLSRMTQFKEKSEKNEENKNAALFTYPVLMAADILVYNADFVPVGIDQKQHLELTRDLAIRFNSRYSDTFKIPEPIINESTRKIMSLKNPEKKMSKSDEDKSASIFLLDDPKSVKKKIMSAVTDSFMNFAYTEDQPGLKNLIDIHCSFSGESPESIVERYKGRGYGEFKKELAEVVSTFIEEFQEKYNEILKDDDRLEKILEEGLQKSLRKTRRMMDKVYRKVGFLQLGK